VSTTLPNLAYGAGGYGQGGYGNEPIETMPLGYYQDLLTSQWKLSPKLNALLYVLLKKFDDVSQCLVSLDLALDLDSAAGAQLDQLGAIAGVARTVGFQPSGGVSPVLDDATYRILIKAKIGQNQWDGTIPGLYPIWSLLFPDGQIVVEDNQNMTATVTLTGSFTSIMQDLISNGYIVPRPEGVLYTYVFGTLPFFGFGSSPGYIAGFGEGHWAT
jgi:Protein of unknown function (DUF2612)